MIIENMKASPKAQFKTCSYFKGIFCSFFGQLAIEKIQWLSNTRVPRVFLSHFLQSCQYKSKKYKWKKGIIFDKKVMPNYFLVLKIL